MKKFLPTKTCLACLGCCRFAEEDSLWLPRLLKEELKCVKKIRLVPGEGTNNFFCAFLNPKNNKCGIYKHRPFDCQLYPFLLCRKGSKIFLSIDLNCPYARDNFKNERSEKYIKYLVKLSKSKKFTGILKNNPQIIQAYPGVTSIYEVK